MGSEFSRKTLETKIREKTLKTSVKRHKTDTISNNIADKDTSVMQAIDPDELLQLVLNNMNPNGRMRRGGWAVVTGQYNLKKRTSFDQKKLRNFYISHLKDQTSNVNHKIINSKTLENNEIKKDTKNNQENINKFDSLNNTKLIIQNINAPTITSEILDIYHAIKQLYLNLNLNALETWEPTPKFSSITFNHVVMSQINTATEFIIKELNIKSISDIVKLIYSCQVIYFRNTKRPKPKTNWIDNIKRQIEIRRHHLSLIQKHLKHIELNNEETKTLKTICRRRRKMKSEKQKTVTNNELNEIAFQIETEIKLYNKRLDVHYNKKKFLRDNYLFECNRKKFYREINKTTDTQPTHINNKEILEFWQSVYCTTPTYNADKRLDLIKKTITPITIESKINIDHKLIDEIIDNLPNWKAAGIDKIYNFFIKNLKPLRKTLICEIQRLCDSPAEIPEFLFQTMTYLIPKKHDGNPSNFRPISCMSNIYKLITKVMTHNLYNILDANGVISFNQLGVKKNTMAAKEQVLFNHCINAVKDFKLKTAWLDIRKAFDSVPYDYINSLIEHLNLPKNYINLMKMLQSYLKLNIIVNNTKIGSIIPRRGIIQGDSLSPLLFTLCMEPVSRYLNEECNPKVRISYKDFNLNINHLLYMDDIKIFSENEDELEELIIKCIDTLNIIGLSHNKEKSSTNTESCTEIADIISPIYGYKYLGLIEDSENRFKSININNIIEKILSRVNKLTRSNLNSKNMFNSINEFALSLLNYFVGIINIPENQLKDWDVQIRNALREHKIHHITANKERLYLKRKNMGRGINSLEFMHDKQLYNLLEKINTKSNYCHRNKLIKLVYENFMISENEMRDNLSKKYNILSNTLINETSLNEAFQIKVFNDILKKEVHNKLFHEITSTAQIKDSSIWLTRGRLNPQTEGNFCNIQDRNLFYKKVKCHHCNKVTASVDHMATRCDKMLYYDYKKRHDELIKIIVTSLLNKYTKNSIKHYKYQKIKNVYEFDNIKILVDIPIKTDIVISENRPDIIMINKKEKIINFIEVGVTNTDTLSQVESWKKRKYELLGREYGRMMGMKVIIIPFVLSWDGHVTEYNRKYRQLIGMNNDVFGYAQSVCLNKTFECIMKKDEEIHM
ncbi:Retrovirus-related Pol polyprotein from type-2 retrotransposable element R2DM [Dictyocoela muelleri]|nr:Retrovirus-related Pol polyprotein from type-2 retrotransposable element R2DM [Dictyocoela muelleri]